MKVAVVGPTSYGGGSTVCKEIVRFLKSKQYDVTFFDNRITSPPPRYWYWYHRVRNILFSTPAGYDKIISDIGSAIRNGGFDAVISDSGLIFFQKLNCMKIYFCRAPIAHEKYFKCADLNMDKEKERAFIDEARAFELATFQRADYVTIAWKTYEEYIKKYVYDGPNIVSHPKGGWSGCTPGKRAEFLAPPTIVYLGSLGRQWNNMSLLARLSDDLPYILDVYGTPEPNQEFKLRYRGAMKNPETELTRYQLGINTVSKEILRRYAYSSKVLMYLAHGLPCLFPEWQKFTYELGGCIPYNERNICDLIEQMFERTKWQELSDQAFEQAQDFSWDKMLQPLLDILD